MRFNGKVAIVSGSSAPLSIGLTTANLLARDGASVVINGRDADQLKAAEDRLRESGAPFASVLGSAEKDDVAQRLVSTAIERFGRLDLVVNTVGGARGSTTPLDITKAGLLDTIELNTWNVLAVVQAAMANGLAADGGGSVVNISSGTVHKTTPMMISYTAGKAALNAITRTLARDLGPRGVRVNGVAPGFTKTSGTQRMWEADDGKAASAQLPLGRMTTAADIANTVVFLLSDDAAAITGVVIDVDGGNHLSSGWSPMSQAPSGGAA